MAKGATAVDFGAFPGKSDASVAVAETGVSNHPSSLAEAWLVPVATADHTADEHWLETIQVMAGPCVAGVGFTIYAKNTSQINEPLVPGGAGRAAVTTFGAHNTDGQPRIGGKGTRLYGLFTVAWAWT